MREWYRKNLTGRRILFLLLLTNAVYLVMLKITIPIIRSFAGGYELPDMMPGGYSYSHINTLINNLGEIGRDKYLFLQLPFDMFYPGLFALTYSTIIAYFLKRSGLLDRAYFYILVFPILGGLFDYLENIGIIIFISTFPGIPAIAVRLASICTILKSIFSTITFTIIIVQLIVFIYRKYIKDGAAKNIKDSKSSI